MKLNKVLQYALSAVVALVSVFLLTTGDAEAAGAISLMSMAPIYIAPDAQRAALTRFENYLIENFPGRRPADYIISDGDIRVEQVLSATKERYNFQLVEGTGNTDRPLERKLSKNDMFFLTHICLGITKQDTTAEDYGNFPIYTDADANFFAGIDGSGNTEAHSLMTVYNGLISFFTSSLKRIDEYPTHNFRYSPERQYVEAAASGLPTGLAHQQYGPTPEARGYQRVTRNLILDGGKDNNFELLLGAGAKALIAGGIDASNASVDTSNVVVLLLKGFIVADINLGANIPDGASV